MKNNMINQNKLTPFHSLCEERGGAHLPALPAGRQAAGRQGDGVVKIFFFKELNKLQKRNEQLRRSINVDKFL
jgi:hypothetical protein